MRALLFLILSLAGTTILFALARERLTVDELRYLPDSLKRLERFLDHPDNYWDVQNYDGIMKKSHELIAQTSYSVHVEQLSHVVQLLEYIHSVAPNCEYDDISIIEDVNRITSNLRLKVLGKLMKETKALNDGNCMTNYEFHMKRPSSSPNVSPKTSRRLRLLDYQ